MSQSPSHGHGDLLRPCLALPPTIGATSWTAGTVIGFAVLLIFMSVGCDRGGGQSSSLAAGHSASAASRGTATPEPAQTAVTAPTAGVELRFVVKLVDPGGRTMLTDPVVVVRDNPGRFLLLSPSKDSVLVFDAAGKHEATLGKRGQSAGEFQRAARLLVGNDGSILVYDSVLRRVTRFDRNLKLQELLQVAYGPELQLPTGDFIVAEQISSRELIGFPVHRVGADGTVRKSFGIDTPQYRPDLKLVVNRLVARATKGGVWTVAPGRYVIERWDPIEGQRLAQIIVKSTWFRETTQFRTNELTPPNAIIEGIWEQDGLLWTLLRDADSKWRPPAAPNTERPHDPAEYDRTYDWVLEAVSPENGQVLASRRFDGLHSVYRPSTLIATSADRAAINLWNVRLDRKEGSK